MWAVMANFSGYSKAWKNRVVVIVSTTMLGAYLVTLGALVWDMRAPRPQRPGWSGPAFLLWTIIPPFWFWFWYFVIWQTEPKTERSPVEEFKWGQELSRNLWLAIVAVMAVVYFKA
jgi:hypothetical protein